MSPEAPTRPPAPLDRPVDLDMIDATAEAHGIFAKEDLLALTAALRLAREAIVEAPHKMDCAVLGGGNYPCGCYRGQALAALDAAVSFSPTGAGDV